MHIMSTNFAKTLVWKQEYDITCDVTNSGHQIIWCIWQIQMTTICHSMKPSFMKIFCVCHWMQL